MATGATVKSDGNKKEHSANSRFSNYPYPLIRLGEVVKPPYNCRDDSFRLDLGNVEIAKQPDGINEERFYEKTEFDKNVVVGKHWPVVNKRDLVCIMSELNFDGSKYSVKDVVLHILNPEQRNYSSPEILRVYEI